MTRNAMVSFLYLKQKIVESINGWSDVAPGSNFQPDDESDQIPDEADA